MNRLELMARIEFSDRGARDRADGLTSYAREITRTGHRSWIVPLKAAHKIVLELEDDGFEIRALLHAR